MDQKKLLKAAKRGNDQAFYELMQQNKQRLYRVAFAYLKDEQDALEAIQEVTYRTYKNIKKVKEPSYFSTWLTRIMINYCNDEMKRKKRMSPTDYDFSLIGKYEDKDDKLGLEAAIHTLEPKLQEVILLKYFEDMTIDQVAEVLECPSGTVKTWLSKALAQLRKHVQKEDGFHV